jgi:hypothetical protein
MMNLNKKNNNKNNINNNNNNINKFNNNNDNNINNFNNNLNFTLTKNVYNDKIIDNRMLPLFKNPIILKEIIDKQRNKYKINLTNKNKKNKLRIKINIYNEIVKLFLKGLTLYKNQLTNYLKKHNYQDLIFYLNKDENYKLNFIISNYFYEINKI